MYSLDTNTVIGILTGRSVSARARLVDAHAKNFPVFISPIVLLELHFGIEKSAFPDRNRAKLIEFLNSPIEILNFDAPDAIKSGQIRATLEKAGTPIGPNDLQIAGQAVERGLVVVTNNTREFSRISGLKLEDWL